ncbi:hypothetical protein, partial [Streptomyces regalis]|uniref:hypothetical protein n=1 Tax=Streptomyces regalis TaxID=68262 RepID=UPI000AF3B1F9
MSVDQLPARVREFVNYLDGLLARLDQGGGWCGVFWQRDPEGMQACLDGREVPPWDVVESLLHDLAAQYGPGGAGPETERARALHAAALATYDSRPGGRDALGDRLDVMLREQRYAAERQADLGRSLASATSQEASDAIRLDLAWARDDHERATARCAELRARMADLDRRAASERGQAIRRDRVGEGSVFRVADGFEGDGFADEGVRDVGSGSGRRQSSVTGSHGGGFPGMPHQRDAQSAAQGEAPAGTAADRHDGRRTATPAAEAAEWRAARRRPGAGSVAEGHGSLQGRPANRYAPGGIAGLSDWPDAQGAGTARPTGQPMDHTAPIGAAAASDWPEVQHSADSMPEHHAQASSIAPDPAPAPDPTPKQRKRRRGSARFAGMDEEEAAPVVVPPTAEPTLPARPVTTGRSPRGARFAGAAAETPADTAPKSRREPMDPADRRGGGLAPETLARQGGEGGTREAQVVFVGAPFR